MPTSAATPRLSLVAATGNRHKIAEMTRILAPRGITLLTPDDCGGMIDIDENGDTFEQNAILKATQCARAWNRTVLADDSGLVVDALHGEPGVRSARYAGEGGNDGRNLRKLLDKMAGVADRRAHFVCVVAVATPDGHVRTATGTVSGTLAEAPRGEGGFGYDPAFIPDGHDRTFGALPAAVNDAMSHRARALESAIANGIL